MSNPNAASVPNSAVNSAFKKVRTGVSGTVYGISAGQTALGISSHSFQSVNDVIGGYGKPIAGMSSRAGLEKINQGDMIIELNYARDMGIAFISFTTPYQVFLLPTNVTCTESIP